MVNNNKPKVNNKSNSMEIEYKNFLFYFKKYKISILKITALTIISTFIYSTFAKKTWEGYIKIVLTNSDPATGIFPGSKSIAVGTALGIRDVSKLNTEVEILKSPSVLLPIFEYVKNEKKKDLENIKKFRYSKWFKENLMVKLERGTTVLNLSYRDNKKDRIIKVLEKTIKAYQNFPQRSKSNRIDREIEYLQTQIETQKNNMKNASEKVQKFALDNKLSIFSSNNSSNLRNMQLLSEMGLGGQQNFKKTNGFEDIFSIKSSLENKLIMINYLIKEFEAIKNNEEKLYVFSLSLLDTLSNEDDNFMNKNISNFKESIQSIADINKTISLKKISFKDNDKTIKILNYTKSRLYDALRFNVDNLLKSNVQSIYSRKSITDNWSQEVLINYSEYKRNAEREESILDNLESNLRVANLQKAKNAKPWELITKPTIKEIPVWPPRKRFVLAFGLILSITFSYIYISIKENNLSNLFK